jgi:hypothetical protein
MMMRFWSRLKSCAKSCKPNIITQIRAEWLSNAKSADGLAMEKDKHKVMRAKLVITIWKNKLSNKSPCSDIPRPSFQEPMFSLLAITMDFNNCRCLKFLRRISYKG